MKSPEDAGEWAMTVPGAGTTRAAGGLGSMQPCADAKRQAPIHDRRERGGGNGLATGGFMRCGQDAGTDWKPKDEITGDKAANHAGRSKGGGCHGPMKAGKQELKNAEETSCEKFHVLHDGGRYERALRAGWEVSFPRTPAFVQGAIQDFHELVATHSGWRCVAGPVEIGRAHV